MAFAVRQSGQVIAKRPEGNPDGSRVRRLERAKGQMNAPELPSAARALESLVAELDGDANAPAQLKAEGRRALANSQFYMTWLLRLEGKTRAEWEPQIEAARQNYRLPAESADSSAEKQDLEAATRLERPELAALHRFPPAPQAEGFGPGRGCRFHKKGKGQAVHRGKAPGSVHSVGDARGRWRTIG